jgi:hypothetical protein
MCSSSCRRGCGPRYARGVDALTYNRAQNLDTDTIARIQRTVGASPDGDLGPKTVEKIKAWQRANGLDDDGRVGPATLQRFRDAWERDDDPDTDEADELPDDVDETIGGQTLAEIQNDLFGFGFEPGIPDGHDGSKTRAAVAAFQRAALGPNRIAGDRRVSVAITYRGHSGGEFDQVTIDELMLWKARGYRWLAPGAEHVERRVRVDAYGRLPRSSRLLVDVPGTQGKPRRLHVLAAAALERMLAAAKAEAGIELLVQSGWRPHRWKDWAHYERTVIAKYGSVARGRKFLAYDSPHETGLAVDFGSAGLFPVSSTIAKQRATPAYAWLVANAWRFGWTPYIAEPWHWEFALSRRAWETGDSDWLGE